MSEKLFADIALNVPIDRTFTYEIPFDLVNEISVGKRVIVNFNNKIFTGVVCSLKKEPGYQKVKTIKSVLDNEPLLTEELISLSKWISEYYISPIGTVIFSLFPQKFNVKDNYYYSLTDNYIEQFDKFAGEEKILIDIIKLFERKKNISLTKKQIEKRLNIDKTISYLRHLVSNNVLSVSHGFEKPISEKLIKIIKRNYSPEFLKELLFAKKINKDNQKKLLSDLSGKDYIKFSEITRNYNISQSVLKTLIKKELIIVDELREFRDYEGIYEEKDKDIILNVEQSECVNILSEALSNNNFLPYLLHGVTGSGKTEVYIRVIENVIKQNKTAIVLVPEISLTPQLVFRFKRKFGNKVCVIHSKISQGEKKDTFDKIIFGDCKIVIGPRSALFSPLRNLGLIVVDEEHDNSYKQENIPKYNARDTAVIRAKINNAVVVLGSATPSMESYYNALNGKYKLLKLTSRATKISMPDVKIIDTTHKDKDFLEKINSDNFFDLINKLRIKFLSTELIYEIGYCLERKESVILLQNRRGYHFYIECLNCNSVETCIRCTIPLTYHKINNNLICHYCGYTKQMIQKCSQCGSSSLVQKGAGTERVEEELKKLFPSAIIERLDSDIVTSKNKYQQILKDFYDKKIDVLVGTQMISKGLDFPEVTLVGVVNADIGLLIPDFRASEKTFQILTQVAGRSGRSEKHGKVLIQTNHPDYELFKSVSSQNYKHFYDNEIKLRQSANFPPYSRLVLIEINSENIKLAESKIKEIYNLIKKSDSKKILDIYPPAQPLFFKLKNHYRYHILVKSPKSKDLSGSYTLSILKTLTEYSKKNFNSKIKITIDVDVINLL